MPCVWCLVPGSYQTTRRQRPLTAPIHDRSIAENSINLILSRHLQEFGLDPDAALDVAGRVFNLMKTHFFEILEILDMMESQIESQQQNQEN